MEDDLWLKTTFNWRQPLIEDNLRWKMTFDWRRSLIEDNLWWKTTFDGRRLLMENDRDKFKVALLLKETFPLTLSFVRHFSAYKCLAQLSTLFCPHPSCSCSQVLVIISQLRQTSLRMCRWTEGAVLARVHQGWCGQNKNIKTKVPCQIILKIFWKYFENILKIFWKY